MPLKNSKHYKHKCKTCYKMYVSKTRREEENIKNTQWNYTSRVQNTHTNISIAHIQKFCLNTEWMGQNCNYQRISETVEIFKTNKKVHESCSVLQ